MLTKQINSESYVLWSILRAYDQWITQWQRYYEKTLWTHLACPINFVLNGVNHEDYNWQGLDAGWNPAVSGTEASVRSGTAKIEEVGRVNEEAGWGNAANRWVAVPDDPKTGGRPTSNWWKSYRHMRGMKENIYSNC